MALLDKVLADGLDTDINAIRTLVLVYSVGIVLLAVYVRRNDWRDPDAAFGELLTGAGLAALIAYALVPYLLLQGIPVSNLGETGGQFDSPQDGIWDVLTLVTGIVLVLVGIGTGLRGQVYVGAFMLGTFVLSVGLDIDDVSPEGKILGWPLLLVILGLALFVFGLLPRGTGPDTDRIGEWYDGGDEAPQPGPSPQVQPPPPRW
jgi:hypothetical protein